MNVNVNPIKPNPSVITQPATVETNDNPTAAVQEKPAVKTDTFETSKAEKQQYKPDVAKVQSMWAEHDQKVESFRRLIEGLLNKQGEKFGTANGWKGINNPLSGEMIQITDEVRAAAKAEIDEGGYFSVEETAKRILSFAVALSGGDPAKLDVLEKAALKGFEEAERVWGGKLPEISYKTMEAVKNGFNQWREAGSASAISLLK